MADPGPEARRKKEAKLVREFVDGPVWEWMRDVLIEQQGRLIALAGKVGLSSEDRALIVGELVGVTRLLHRPASILQIAVEAEKQVEERARRAAPAGAPSLV